MMGEVVLNQNETSTQEQGQQKQDTITHQETTGSMDSDHQQREAEEVADGREEASPQLERLPSTTEPDSVRSSFISLGDPPVEITMSPVDDDDTGEVDTVAIKGRPSSRVPIIDPAAVALPPSPGGGVSPRPFNIVVDDDDDLGPAPETQNSPVEPVGPRVPITVAFGPRGGWYVRWSDGTSGWESLPPSLHTKLNNRNRSLPGVRQMGMSDTNEWFVSFDDGSFATSGFPPRGRLFDALHNEGDADVTNLVFAPGGGWLLAREDGTCVYERLPTGLADLLKRRHRDDPPIKYVAISKLGGWFVMFEDRECEWEALPAKLGKILVQTVRKNPKHLVVALSPADMNAYLVAAGTAYDTNVDHPNFRAALQWTNDGYSAAENDPIPINNINFAIPVAVPDINSSEYQEIFQNASAFGDVDDGNADDENTSEPSGTEIRSLHSASVNLLHETDAPVDGNVEAEEGGRLLLRAASNSGIYSPGVNSTKNSKWSGAPSPIPSLPVTSPPGSAQNAKSGDLPAPLLKRHSSDNKLGVPQSSAGLSSFFSSMTSVFGALGGSNQTTPKEKETVATSSSSRGRSMTRQESQRAMAHLAPGGTLPPLVSNDLLDDSYDGETDSMLDRVAQLKMQVQERLSQTREGTSMCEQLIRFSKTLDSHAYQLSSGVPATQEILAEVEYLVLYAEGWLDATDPAPLPNPWMNGWVEGKYGYSMEDVMEAVHVWTGGGSGTEDLAVSSDQQTINRHLMLSYIYEAEFKWRGGGGGEPNIQVVRSSDEEGQHSSSSRRETSKSPKRDSGFSWERSRTDANSPTSGSLPSNPITLLPSTIHFSTDTIPETLPSQSTPLYHLVTDLARNLISMDDMPPLRVFQVDESDVYWTVDNQELWVLQKAGCAREIECTLVDASLVDALGVEGADEMVRRARDWAGDLSDGVRGRSVRLVETVV
ncbi:hypothetical protein DFS34DRAFT_683864 [Phlyctochytrium arcticum]|nr:hypothetical protein DFS34DRAFT_683864 [Phlyctochytrium arcticum]